MAKRTSRAKTKRSANSTKRVSLEELIAETARELSDQCFEHGSIHVQLTDEGERQYHIRRGGQIDASGPEGSAIQIRSSSKQLIAALNGSKHPTRVFLEGGIVVRGHVRQTTALANEVPLLTVKRRRS